MSNANSLPQLTMTQAAAAVAGAIKVAKAAEAKLAAAPKAVPQTEIDKTAALLVEHGWITQDRVETTKQALADPATAMLAIQNIVNKVAQDRGQDHRLANGKPVSAHADRYSPAPRTKSAADDESEADRLYRERIESYAMTAAR